MTVSRWAVIVGTENLSEILEWIDSQVEAVYVVCPRGMKKVIEDRAKRIYAWETDWNRENYWREAEVIGRMGGDIHYIIVYADKFIPVDVDWSKNRIYYVEEDGKKEVVAVVLVQNTSYATYWIRHAFDLMSWIDWLVITLKAEATKVEIPVKVEKEEEIVSQDVDEAEKEAEEMVEKIKKIEKSLKLRKIQYSYMTYDDRTNTVAIFVDKVEKKHERAAEDMSKKYGCKVIFVEVDNDDRSM